MGMTLLVVLLIATLIWLVLASTRDGRGEAPAPEGRDTWMVEQHERVVRLGREAAIPPDHPLSHLDLGHRPRQAMEVRS
jgi:hypothetical protein